MVLGQIEDIPNLQLGKQLIKLNFGPSPKKSVGIHAQKWFGRWKIPSTNLTKIQYVPIFDGGEKGSLGVPDGAGGLSLSFLESQRPDTQFVHVKILIPKTLDFLAVFWSFLEAL